MILPISIGHDHRLVFHEVWKGDFYFTKYVQYVLYVRVVLLNYTNNVKIGWKIWMKKFEYTKICMVLLVYIFETIVVYYSFKVHDSYLVVIL